MSQSQQSNFASSLCDSDLDNLSYLTLFNYLATPSSSHYTIETFDPNLLRPNDSLIIPSCLIRVRTDRRKAFVLYDKMTHNDQVDQWLQTDFGRKSKIKQDLARHSEIQKQYHQVAQSINGALKVICQRYGAILKHPYTTNRKQQVRRSIIAHQQYKNILRQLDI